MCLVRTTTVLTSNIKEKYEIPNKYHLEDVDFHRSPWIQKLLRNEKIEPTNEQLIDFSAYCVGTYAILRIRDLNLFEYYSVFLASAESIEKPESLKCADCNCMPEECNS
jgi:hypothetical protein